MARSRVPLRAWFALFPFVVLLAMVCFTPMAASDIDSKNESRAAADINAPFNAVPLPDPAVPGFMFPEKEDTILSWVEKNDQHAINRHAWGLWTALTSPSGQFFQNQELRVFETWVTPQDLLAARFRPGRQLAGVRRDPRPLTRLRQLVPRRAKLGPNAGEETVLGFVKYDPSAAKHISDNDLFSRKKLGSFLAAGQTQIPPFPNSGISLKVVFKTLDRSSLVEGRYAMLPAWPGPPDPPAAFGPKAWKQCVWVDVKDPGVGPGTGKADTICKADGSSRTAETTYGVGHFINFRLSSTQALLANAVRVALKGTRDTFATEGDYAVLLGMHVTTREITRWTWSTFWWSHDSSKPPLPSSEEIANDRPQQLKGAARNYSHVSSYTMAIPPQPNTGGSNAGESVYAYNPWLEAGFGPSVLPASKPGKYMGKPVQNNVGVQTNCMSCHAQAAYDPQGDLGGTLYTGDQYIDLNGAQFNGKLRVDFLWSIPDNATNTP